MDNVKKFAALLTVKFSVQVSRDENSGFVGQKNQKIEDAIRTDKPDFSFSDHILFTDFEIDVIVKGRPKQKVFKAAILPSLLCGWLKSDSRIDTERLSKRKAAKQPKGNPGDSSQNTDEETIFFVKTDGMKAQDSITVLSDKDYKFREICVSAVRGDSFEEALKKDGRFVNIDRWKITEDDNKSSLSLNSEAQHYPNAVFHVSVKRTDRPKRKAAQTTIKQEAADPISTFEIPAEAAKKQRRDGQTDLGSPRKLTVKKSRKSTKHDGEVGSQEEEGECEENAEAYITGVYRFSKPRETVSSNERREEMHNCIKRNAKFTLVHRSKRNEYDKEIPRIAREQFASRINVARPARLSKYIAGIFPSVGRIVCGAVQGTCFLVSDDMVITNNHLVEDIQASQRIASDRIAHRSITINFDFDAVGQSNASGGIEVARLDDPRNIRDEGLDYAFLALEAKVEGKTPLGDKVKKYVPESGLLVVVGHPEGREKLEDTCTIIPKADRQKEISQRVQKQEVECLANPQKCNRVNSDVSRVKCIHLYNPAMNIAEKNDMITSYDTSNMFHGSSGSPVINMSGEIVAIHSCGFSLQEGETKTSLLEYGFTFEAIINNLIEKGLSEKVKSFFPFCEIEAMDET